MPRRAALFFSIGEKFGLDDWTVFVIVDGGGVIAQFIPRQRAVQYLRLGQRGAARRQALVVRQTALGNANFAWVQHIIYHLAPTGIAGFVLANGSMSSN